MTNGERLINAFNKEKSDRIPIWLREGFYLPKSLKDKNDFTENWMDEDIYMDLYNEVVSHLSFLERINGYGFNRILMVPNKYIEIKEEKISDRIIRRNHIIHTNNGDKEGITETKRGYATSWEIDQIAHNIDDLYDIISLPFEIDYEKVKENITSSYKRAIENLEDRGIPKLVISSPIVIISGCMPFEDFLLLTITEKEFVHELLKEITKRILMLIDEHFKYLPKNQLVILGGSEQCTPPMMAPKAFDEFVARYDKEIVDKLHSYGAIVQCHCHGKVRHALEVMKEIGYDATDPVEPYPAGDVSFEEALKIADGKITLLGNLEFDELEYSKPEEIKERVKNILSFNANNVILGASAGPCSAISKTLVDNYRMLVNTAINY